MEDTTPAPSTNATAAAAEVKFSDHVETTLTNVFESQTELDSASFDAISYINQNFPNERSLQRVNQFLHMTTQKLETLDQGIYQSVLEQATSGKQAGEDVAAVKTAIRDLFQKIKDIKEKAEESEVMVQEISRDIKKLDYAKRHLTTTITGLKRLHMLVTAVDQLEFMAQRREYRDAANLLNAVNQLSKHFEQYNGVPKVDELRKAVTDTRRALKAQVLQDFRDIQLPAESDVSGDTPDYDRDQLHNACLVVDALGKEVRSRITERFCCDQLSEYDGIFRSGGGEDTLEAVERRYALWRRMLRRYEKTFANVFPGYWEVDMELCVDFARRTRRHIEKILQSIIPPESADVGVLLKALKTTLKFERESEKMFHSFDNEEGEDSGGRSSDLQERRRTVRASSDGGGDEFSDDEEDEEEKGEALYDDEGNEVDPDSATGIRLKYKRRQEMERRKQEFKERGLSGGDTKDGGDTNVSNRRRRGSRAKSTGANEEEEEEEEVTPKVSFLGLISSCFGNYMAAYVQLERDNMNTKLRDFDVQEVDEDMKKFSTSYNMFGYMHNSIKRCCDLNTGQAFYDLHLEYKAVLNEFATILSNQLVRPSGTKNSFGETVYKFGESDDIPRLACYIVNTAEYCLDNMPKLQDNIQSRIDDEYKERIDLEEDEDSFYEVINAAIKVLAGGLQNRVTPKLEVRHRRATEERGRGGSFLFFYIFFLPASYGDDPNTHSCFLFFFSFSSLSLSLSLSSLTHTAGYGKNKLGNTQ